MTINATQSTLNILRNIHPTFMHLQIFIDSNENDVVDTYINAINNHNNKLLNPNNQHIDAGFDLFVPTQTPCPSNQTTKIDMQVKCSAQIISSFAPTRNTGYYMYPRSSISNTPLRLANSVGIIDSGYRGRLMGKFDTAQNFIVNKFDRLLQICAPGLIPIFVELVNNAEELGETERGAGGFGSTGR